MQPPHVVLVHGEKNEMMRLKSALEKGAVEKGIPRTVYTPAIMQTVKVRACARARGRPASTHPAAP